MQRPLTGHHIREHKLCGSKGKASLTCVQGVRHALHALHAKADERDLVAVNDHPDEVCDAAKEQKDEVELGSLTLASKRRCSQTQREGTTGRTVE
jgi:hypothetical protein